ncbi:hypothetical protein F5Y18DRAFT_338636 [Xylariaceae sp. FL1019]|nr:hypothetical protein F5Y18DRAFT_338636 [Xylariaceae sp. FL1019]
MKISLPTLLALLAGLMVSTMTMPIAVVNVGLSAPDYHHHGIVPSKVVLDDIATRSAHQVLPIGTDPASLRSAGTDHINTDPARLHSVGPNPVGSDEDTHCTYHSPRDNPGDNSTSAENNDRAYGTLETLSMFITITNMLLFIAVMFSIGLYLWREHIKDTARKDSRDAGEETSSTEGDVELDVIHARSAPNWPLSNTTSSRVTEPELVIQHCHGHDPNDHRPNPFAPRSD